MGVPPVHGEISPNAPEIKNELVETPRHQDTRKQKDQKLKHEGTKKFESHQNENRMLNHQGTKTPRSRN